MYYFVRTARDYTPIAVFFDYEDAEHFVNIQYAYMEELVIVEVRQFVFFPRGG